MLKFDVVLNSDNNFDVILNKNVWISNVTIKSLPKRIVNSFKHEYALISSISSLVNKLISFNRSEATLSSSVSNTYITQKCTFADLHDMTFVDLHDMDMFDFIYITIE